MKNIFLLGLAILSISLNIKAQDFDSKINKVAEELSKKIISSPEGNSTKAAIVEFDDINGYVSQLGIFLSEEIASTLANLTSNQTKFRLLEREKLDLILSEKKILKSYDRSKLARDLGKIDAADVLICATITDFNGYYRVNIKLLDTRTGDALSSYKESFVKEPSLIELQKKIVENKPNSNTAEKIEIDKSNTEQPSLSSMLKNTENKSPGNLCIVNNGRNCHAVVYVKNPDTGVKIKTLDALLGQESCVYNLSVGVYQLEIVWYWWYSSKNKVERTDTKEINIKSGVDNKVSISY